MRRCALGWLAAALVISAPPSALAYCPSYTLSSTNNSYNCGIEAVEGQNPTIAEWQKIFDLVAQGPSVFGDQGPAIADIGQGCGKPEALHDVPARFPCEIMKAIAMAESGWTQFCVPDQPADQVGGPSRTIISFDCGYGVGQVTSGMHVGETPSFDRQRVAGDPTYDLATGASILAEKWRATNCVGDNQPSLVEDWYTAVWAYNGLSYSNNPNNPNYSSSRGVWDPSVGGAAPYQEKVFGRIEFPSGDPAYWQAVALAYPDPSGIGSTGSPPDLPEPSCASPTDCTNTRSVHVSNCFASEPVDGGAGTAGTSGSGGSSSSGGSTGVGGTGGAHSDGGIKLDGGTKKSKSEDDGGCSCRSAAPARTGAAWLGLAGVFFLVRRRRLL